MKLNPENKTCKPGTCCTRGCTNKTNGRKLCSTCRSKVSRLKDTIRYAFNNLRASAAKREIYFDLTLEQFTEFCHKTEYIAGKGKTLGSFNVDRIIEGKTPGYTASNIQCLDKLKNIQKYHLHYDWQNKTATVWKSPDFSGEDNPF